MHDFLIDLPKVPKRWKKSDFAINEAVEKNCESDVENSEDLYNLWDTQDYDRDSQMRFMHD